MSKPIKRVYTFSDDVMLQRAQVVFDALSEELADFSARFPWLDAVWLAAFGNDIQAANAFAKDNSTVLEVKVLTGDVGSAQRQGYAALQTLGWYAKLAWPADVARQRVFGQDRWRDAYDHTLKLQQALELAHSKAEDSDYKGALLAKGYTQAEMDSLETLSEEIMLKNRLQEAAKNGRTVSSHDRVAIHNTVWHHLQTVGICAGLVWRNDAERRGRYNLYVSKTLPAVAAQEAEMG